MTVRPNTRCLVGGESVGGFDSSCAQRYRADATGPDPEAVYESVSADSMIPLSGAGCISVQILLHTGDVDNAIDDVLSLALAKTLSVTADSVGI